MPGPLAAQVAMWLGYLEAGARGAVAVAVPFVLPPFVIVTAVAVLYAQYGGLSWVHALFLGVRFAGAVAATLFVFLPALLLVVIPGPLIRRHEKHPRLQGFIKGATAAAAGAIAGAGIVIASDVITSRWSVVIAVTAFIALLQRKVKVREPALVAAAAVVGLLAFS